MKTLFRREKNLDAFVAACAEEAQVANMLHHTNWRLGEEASWHLDQNSGQLLLTFDDGSFAIAPAQVIGSFHHKDSNFMWGWKHPSIHPALKKSALIVKEFGKEQAAKELTKGNVICTERKAWELTALAMHLGHAKGTYRVIAKPGISLFLTFGEIQVAQEART